MEANQSNSLAIQEQRKAVIALLKPIERKFCEKYVELNFDRYKTAQAIYPIDVRRGLALVHRCLSSYECDRYIKILKNEWMEDTSNERIMIELAKIAFSDIRDLYDENGRLLSAPELGVRISGAIQSIESTDIMERDGEGGRNVVGFNRRVKMHDKLRALEMLARLNGMDIGETKVQQISMNIVQSNLEEE